VDPRLERADRDAHQRRKARSDCEGRGMTPLAYPVIGDAAFPVQLHDAHRRSRSRSRWRGRSAVRLSSVTTWLLKQDQPLALRVRISRVIPIGPRHERTGALRRDS
jgi:hypothetical protein